MQCLDGICIVIFYIHRDSENFPGAMSWLHIHAITEKC